MVMSFSSRSSITELPPPPLSILDQKDTDTSWDSTFPVTADDSWNKWTSSSNNDRSFLCAHAVVHPPYHIVHKDWSRSMAPHQIVSISSNKNGTVIVVITDVGWVSLLRGCDGAILATRRMAAGSSSSSITESHSSSSSSSLSLLVVPRLTWLLQAGNNNDDDNNNNNTITDGLWMESTANTSEYIYVGNIQGHLLNTNHHAATTAEAARAMTMTTVSLSTTTMNSISWRAVSGYYVSPTIVRLVACDDDGRLEVYDYDTITQTTTCIQDKIKLQGDHNNNNKALDEEEEDWCVDYEVGMQPIQFRNKIYFLVCLCFGKQTMLHWFDPVTLASVCSWQVEDDHGDAAAKNSGNSKTTASNSVRPKVLAMQPLVSEPDNESLAVAVAVSTPSNRGGVHIQVVRVLADETFGLWVLSKPHVLYRISLDETTCAIELAAMPTTTPTADEPGPYSFRFKCWTSTQTSKDFVFTAGSTSSTVSQWRKLLELECFDQLNEELKSDASVLEEIMQDGNVVFSTYEVYWKRLQSMLSKGLWTTSKDQSGESNIIAEECLDQLAKGAMSGDDKAVTYLLEATDFCVGSLPNPTLAMMSHVLQQVASRLDRVLSTTHLVDERKQLLKKKHNDVCNRLLAIEFLETAVQNHGGAQLQLAGFLQSVRSPSHLFSLLMEHKYFAVAEQMWLSNLRSHLTPEVLLTSLYKIPESVAPSKYMAILRDILFPSLSIGHELLGPVRSWVCRTADALDESELNAATGLDDAIVLLEAAAGSLRDLHLRVHESFATSSPFVERDPSQFVIKRSQRHNTHTAASLSASKDSSRDAGRSAETNTTKPVSAFRSVGGMYPAPTLLQLGVLDRGAIKSRFSTTVRADQRYDMDNECVTFKLQEARCLQRARLVGLDKSVATLRNLSQLGGAQYVAYQLVALLSSSTDNHETREEFLIQGLKPFCDEFDIDYDAAVYDYIRKRCRGKSVSHAAICESGSLTRCCQSFDIKSQATLIVLQASLLCGYAPSWLAKLVVDAKSWASFDSDLQSKLEEAWRLLTITSIVVKYCGQMAREMFRIDNPRHAIRLMDYVTQHIHHGESVLEDIFSLCDAFIHLNLRDCCRALIQRAVLLGDEVMCTNIMAKLCLRSLSLAEGVMAGTILFVEEILTDCSDKASSSFLTNQDDGESWMKNGMTACQCATAVLAAYLDRATSSLATSDSAEILCFVENGSLEALRDDLSRITRLQKEFSIWISLSGLRSKKVVAAAVSKVLDPVVKAYSTAEPELLVNKIAIARRACSLIVKGTKTDIEEFWLSVCADAAVKMVRQREDDRLLEFCHSVGILLSGSNGTIARAQLALALSLCGESGSKDGKDPREGMPRLVQASVIVRNQSIASASGKELAAAISLGSVVDIACEILTRGDEGVGEHLDALRESLQVDVWRKKLPHLVHQESIPTSRHDSSIRRPILHKRWYIGDGLLLPPDESLDHSLRFCKGLLMGNLSTTNQTMDFLRVCGAHGLALRLLCSTSTRCATSTRRNAASDACDDLSFGVYQSMESLAVRSLGGSSHSGMTSSLVDSELSVAYLLSLPPKQAFKIYLASLPTAMKTRDFERSYALANIGSMSCLIDNESTLKLGGFFAVGWKLQDRFYEQCQELGLRSMWWAILKHFNVDFDTQQFGETGSKVDKKYVDSLLPRLISGMSEKLNVMDLLKGCKKFAAAFGLAENLVFMEHVRYLLTVPEESLLKKDIRSDINMCEKVASRTLRMMQSPIECCGVLQQCLCDLERSAIAQQDYERLSVVLSLYHASLVALLDSCTETENVDVNGFERDLELVDRRRDALAILSSFFQGERHLHRPPFAKFFLPMDDLSGEAIICGILGKQAGAGEDVFDPLAPLESVFTNAVDMAPATALAPMCLSLGVPKGYIHARALMKKFENNQDGAANLPSFEHDVVPVIGLIRAPKQRAELAEWCAIQYVNSDADRLKCLDLALTAAILASAEIERKRQFSAKDDKALEMAENLALESIKRLDSAKAALSDRLRIIAILRAGIVRDHDIVTHITNDFLRLLSEKVCEGVDLSPDSLINFAFSNASLLAAKACLDGENPLSMDQFRRFCTTVNDACRSIADHYSHVDLSRAAKRLAWRWLFHGTPTVEPVQNSTHNSNDGSRQTLQQTVINEDETVSFVMDLADLQSTDDQWSGRSSMPKPSQITSEEEQSAVKAQSVRELSESSCHLEALRIAFVLAFEDVTDCIRPDDEQTENSAPNRHHLASVKSKRPGLLAKLETKRDNRHEVMISSVCRELLRIVFAKSEQSSHLCVSASFLGVNDSVVAWNDPPATVTFAMRHRALRAASVLCPQEALERVIHEDGYLRTGSGADVNVSLRECAFGSFVAKEIEEMGLPLPHSDLGQLSSMNFLSYARTLWRHHHDDVQNDQRGRLLLLLLEMSLKGESSDATLINSILDEMISRHLPRSLLLAIERIAFHENRRETRSFSVIDSTSVKASIEIVTKAVFSEAERWMCNECVDADVDKNCLGTVYSIHRLGDVMVCLADSEKGRSQLNTYTSLLQDLQASTKIDTYKKALRNSLSRAFRRLHSHSSALNSPADHKEVTTEGFGEGCSTLVDALSRLEASLPHTILSSICDA